VEGMALLLDILALASVRSLSDGLTEKAHELAIAKILPPWLAGHVSLFRSPTRVSWWRSRSGMTV
jgi:hypothetical protein